MSIPPRMMHPPIMCTHHVPVPGAASASKALARFCCLSCSRYLCSDCDRAAHSGTTSAHYRFPVTRLRTYIDVEHPPAPGESHIRRSLHAQQGPKALVPRGGPTLISNFKRAVERWGDRPCLGRRDPSGGPYQFQTYAEIGERVQRAGAGLALLLQSGGGGGGAGEEAPMDRVGLYSLNRPEWVIAEYGCYLHSLVPVPLYDTLGAEAAAHVVNTARVGIIVCTADKLEKLEPIASKLRAVVIMDAEPSEDIIPKNFPARVLSFAQLEQMATAPGMSPPAERPAQPEDLATVCFTSGTTGLPKGAQLTHRNLVCNFSAIEQHGVDLSADDVHISYLPLAHMFERIVQAFCLSHGAAIGFFRGDTLQLVDDVAALRPTVFVGVPRLYNRLVDKVKAALPTTGVSGWLFRKAYASKRKNLVEHGIVTHPIYDRLVFSKIAARLGGRVRLMITGSAPISGPVLEFLRIAFSVNVIEGYGQTETSAAGTITAVHDTHAAAHVGVPLPSMEVKLVDVPDMGYRATDTIDGVPCPRGEIWVRGPNVFKGYIGRPQETTDDGWLPSGDIGVWRPDGQLKIIDRKKALFKLAQGEYVAPEKIENALTRAPLIAQAFVHGDSLQSYLVAVIVVDEEVAAPLGLMQDQEKLRQAVARQMVEASKAAKLNGFEMVKAFHLEATPFDVENGLLTPTFKLKRAVAAKHYADVIQDLYAQGVPTRSKL